MLDQRALHITHKPFEMQFRYWPLRIALIPAIVISPLEAVGVSSLTFIAWVAAMWMRVGFFRASATCKMPQLKYFD